MNAISNINVGTKFTTLGTLSAALLLPSGQIQGATYLHSDVEMSNIQLSAAASSFVWLTDWQLSASASSFDSLTGFAVDAQSASGQPAIASAAVAGGLSSAAASVGVDASGQPTSLQAVLDATFPTSGDFANSFSTASAYREFELTGGSGSVNVAFGFDYLAHLAGDAPGYWIDYRAVLDVSDGTDTLALLTTSVGDSPVTTTFAGTTSQTFSLQYGTPYSLTLSADPDDGVANRSTIPETGVGDPFALVALSLCLVHGVKVSRARWRLSPIPGIQCPPGSQKKASSQGTRDRHERQQLF